MKCNIRIVIAKIDKICNNQFPYCKSCNNYQMLSGNTMGYPLGYFEEIDRIVADDMIEREQPYDLDERDKLE